MLELVPVQPKSLEDYRPIIGDGQVEEIRALAAPLKGARVVHVNATAFGGGVAEILQTLVPLMRDVGLEVDWQVIEGYLDAADKGLRVAAARAWAGASGGATTSATRTSSRGTTTSS